MKPTYAVKWREPDGRTYLGRLVLGVRTLFLEGRERDGPAINTQIGYEEILSHRVGSRGGDRLDGQPALVVERTGGRYLVTSAGMGAGIVHELVERLADFRRSPARATVVVPLREGALAGVRELIGNGPPFDPDETALTRHQVFLTEREAIFIFEAQTEEGLAALLARLEIWAAADSWREFVSGVPRLASVAYAWERPEPRIVPAVGLGL